MSKITLIKRGTAVARVDGFQAALATMRDQYRSKREDLQRIRQELKQRHNGLSFITKPIPVLSTDSAEYRQDRRIFVTGPVIMQKKKISNSARSVRRWYSQKRD